MSDFRKRIRLVHELRKLGGPEELTDRGHHRFSINQIMWHGRGHFLVHAHLFFDGAFHAHQSDAELVFQQLADGAHAAVPEMIDVVHRADILAQFQQVTNRPIEIVRIERALIEIRRILVFEQLDVELQPAHA